MLKLYLAFIGILLLKLALSQTTVTIPASMDNTIYSENNNVSNGAGQNFFAGVTNRGAIRRALLRFDLSAIPAGAVVSSATLNLYVNRKAAASQGIRIHKLTKDWGEGTSDATANEGRGAAATTND